MEKNNSYQFLELDYLNKGDWGLNIQDLKNKTIDGILIRNTLTTEVVQNLLKHLENKSLEKVYRDEISIYPKGFAAFMDEPNVSIDDYYAHGENYNQSFNQNFRFDLEKHVQDVINALSDAKVSRTDSRNGSAPFGQFRDLYSGKSGMPLHCGRVFQDFYSAFYESLDSNVAFKEQISYFIMLQKTEKGGELVLIDKLWEDGQKMKPFDEMINKDGSILNINDSNVTKTTFNPLPGDMIIFRGSNIWHKVNDILGESNRITFGGFMSFIENKNEICLWS